MPKTNHTPAHDIEILRALAYLFAHPEIDSHIERVWNPVDNPRGTQTYTFSVDSAVMEGVMIRFAGTAVRPMKPLPLVKEIEPHRGRVDGVSREPRPAAARAAESPPVP